MAAPNVMAIHVIAAEIFQSEAKCNDRPTDQHCQG